MWVHTHTQMQAHTRGVYLTCSGEPTQSQEHYTQRPHDTHSHRCAFPTRSQADTKKGSNKHPQTHAVSHTGPVLGTKGRELLGWIGSGWGRSGLVHLISTGLILTLLTLTQAIHHVISPTEACVCVCGSVCSQVYMHVL